ncbi:MAG: Lrp/AsnC family transcriptional regulator [Planctomycetota bacterium]
MASDLEKALIIRLQDQLPIVPRPFAVLAGELGVSEDEVIECLRGMQEKKYLRRIAAVLWHRTAGFEANGMGAWNVPDERCREIGEKMASFSEVTHCYRRPRFPDWRYNLYTMIHGRTREACRAVAERIAKATGISDYDILFSTREFKKTSPVYYPE